MQQIHDMIRLCILTYWITSAMQMYEPNVVDSQTVTFRDGEQTWSVAYPDGGDVTRDVAVNTDTSLAKFFERPVMTTTYSWLPGGPLFTQTFDPWSVFFGGARVINRITNFNLMKAKLHVKFMINGNPFYYGRLMSDYHILPLRDQLTNTSGLIAANRVTASQRMHVFLDPTTNMGATMELPFIWPYDTLNVPNVEWNQLGRVHIRQLVGLKHANGSTDPLEITVSMWASDVDLSIPTVVDANSLVPQSDEYSSSPISNTATTISAATNTMSKIPVIGPYMKATSQVASMLGSMAKTFGYSRPALIADASGMRPEYVGPLANTDRGDPVTKLTMDSKQELCVDASVCGVKTGDELVLSEIASRESYITSFPMPISAVVDTLLWNTRVTPINGVAMPDGGIALPACTFVALPFKYWRGTMRYRFQIVASAYHKGRLRFVYDPGYVSSLESNVSYTKIVDLANERDFTLDISWASEKHFLGVGTNPVGATFGSLPITSAERSFHNGVLGVYVLNKLTAPSSLVNNDITINVYVSMCDDCEFAEPEEQYLRLGTYIPPTGTLPNAAMQMQSVSETVELSEKQEYPAEELQFQSETIQDVAVPEENAPVATEATDAVLTCLPVDHTYDVYFGEKITSFRNLLKRYNFVTAYSDGVPAANALHSYELRDFPLYRGLNAGALTLDGANRYCFHRFTLLNYVTPAYVGIRGGIRNKYLWYGFSANNHVVAQVTRGGPTGVFERFTSTLMNTTSNLTTAKLFATKLSDTSNVIKDTYAGSHVSPLCQQPSIEVELPFYEAVRFKEARNVTLLDTMSHHATHYYERMAASASLSGALRYVSTGEDFNLFLFQGAPTFYIYELPA